MKQEVALDRHFITLEHIEDINHEGSKEFRFLKPQSWEPKLNGDQEDGFQAQNTSGLLWDQ